VTGSLLWLWLLLLFIFERNLTLLKWRLKANRERRFMHMAIIGMSLYRIIKLNPLTLFRPGIM